jgi:hypothetical protein
MECGGQSVKVRGLPIRNGVLLTLFYSLTRSRVRAHTHIVGQAQICCTACFMRSPPLPWDARSMSRGVPEEVIPLGPEQLLAAQLFAHGVPVHGGYFPLVLVRGGARPPECHRHAVCSTVGMPTSSTAVRDLAPPRGRDLDGGHDLDRRAHGRDWEWREWPRCPTSHAERRGRCERFAAGLRRVQPSTRAHWCARLYADWGVLGDGLTWQLMRACSTAVRVAGGVARS